MESLLPSEVARLVYGYLEQEKCCEASQSFLEHSPHLVECLAYARQGKIFTTTVAKSTLIDILEEYCAIRRLVSERLQKMPEDTAGQIRHCATLLEQLRHLLDASKAGQTVLVSITVPPQGSSSQSSSNLPTSVLSNRARARVCSTSDKSKRTSIRWLGPGQESNKQQHTKDIEEYCTPYNVSAVEATPLESLPGLIDSRSTQTSARKDREENEKPMPKTSTPSKSVLDLQDSLPSCSFSEEGNMYTSSPKRKYYANSKRKCTNPTPVKNQTPPKARWSHSEENDSNESVDISVLTKALLGNTELHEKLAENINSVIHPGTEQTQVDPAPQTTHCDGMINELNNAIKTIVSRTESDPLFERLLEEIIGPVEEMTPSPAERQSESDDTGTTKVSGEEETEPSAKASNGKKKSVTPARSQPQVEEAEESTDVPLKQRLRSARQRKSDIDTSVSVSPATGAVKEKKKEASATSLEDQNAAAIQCIVDVNITSQQGTEKEIVGSSTTIENRNVNVLSAQNAVECSLKNVQPTKSTETVAEISKPFENVMTADILSASAALSGITAESDKPFVVFDGNVACVDAAVSLPLSQPLNSTMSQLTAPLFMTMTQPASTQMMAFTIPSTIETVPHLATFTTMTAAVTGPAIATKPCTINEKDIMSMPTVIVCGSEPAVPRLINPGSAVGNLLNTNRYIPIAPKDGSTTILSGPPVEQIPIIRNPLSDGELQTILNNTSNSANTYTSATAKKTKLSLKEKPVSKQVQTIKETKEQSITLYGSGDAVVEMSSALSLPTICLESPEFKKTSNEKEDLPKENPEPSGSKNSSSIASKETEHTSNSTDENLSGDKSSAMSLETSAKSDDKTVKHNGPLSPQLISLVNISTRNAGNSKQKESPNKGMGDTMSRSTPQTCLSQNRTLGASSKRLSLSTPRRQRNHVRALDFTTPPKSGISSRRPNTSPKLLDCKRVSQQCAEKFKKCVRRTGLFKSPPSFSEAKVVLERLSEGDNVHDASKPNSSIDAATETEESDRSLIKLPETEAPPIATRSPAVKLTGGWDKYTGVGLILNENTSPVNVNNQQQTQENVDNSSANKQTRKEEKPHREKITKPKEAWDAHLRSVLKNDNRFIRVQESPEKIKKKKSSRVFKAAKEKKAQQETEVGSKQLDNANNKVDNGKEMDGNDDNIPDSPNAEGLKKGPDEAKELHGKCENTNVKSITSKSTNNSKREKSKRKSGSSKRRILKLNKVAKDDKDNEPSKEDVTDPNQGTPEAENASSCVGKVIQSPTKLNASKRMLVHQNSILSQKLNMDEAEDNTETLVIRTEERVEGKTAILAANVSASANEPVASQNEDASTPTKTQEEAPQATNLESEESPILDTPRKADATVNSIWGADVSLTAPITPRIISPSVEDTPLTKLVRERVNLINFSSIQTPSFPPTPNIAVTPQSCNSATNDSPGYNSRPTDYSSCSSYYKPLADNDHVNETILEQVLINECQRIESDKTSEEKNDETSLAQEESKADKANGQGSVNIIPEAAGTGTTECYTENAIPPTPSNPESLAEEAHSDQVHIPCKEPQSIVPDDDNNSEPSSSKTRKRERTKSGASTTGTVSEASRHSTRLQSKESTNNNEEKLKEQMIKDHIKDVKLKLFGQHSSCDDDSDESTSETETPKCHRYPLRSRGKHNEKVNDKMDTDSEGKGAVRESCLGNFGIDLRKSTKCVDVTPAEDIHILEENAVTESSEVFPLVSQLPKDGKMCLELEEKKRRTLAKLKGIEISPEVVPNTPVQTSHVEQQTLTYSIENIPCSVEVLISKTKLTDAKSSETTQRKLHQHSVEAIAERLAREKNAIPPHPVQELTAELGESSEEFPALRLSTDEEMDSDASQPQSQYAMVESRMAALHGENELDSTGKSAVATSTPVTAVELCNDLETPTKSDTEQEDSTEVTGKSSRYMNRRLKDVLGENISPINSTEDSGKILYDTLTMPKPVKETLEKQGIAPAETGTLEKVHCKEVIEQDLQPKVDSIPKENSRSFCSKRTLVDGTLYMEIIYQDEGPKGKTMDTDLSQCETSFLDDEDKIIKIGASDFQELFCYIPPVEDQSSQEIKKHSVPVYTKRKSRADFQVRNRDHRKSRSPQRERLLKPSTVWDRAPSPTPCTSKGKSSNWSSGRHRESPSPPRWQSRNKCAQSPAHVTRRDSAASRRFSMHRRSRSHSMDRRRRSPSLSYHRRRKPSPFSRRPASYNQKKCTAMISPLNQLYEECVREERDSSKVVRSVSRQVSRTHKEPVKRTRRKESSDDVSGTAEQNSTSASAEQQGLKTKNVLPSENELLAYALIGSARQSTADDPAVQENQNQSRDHHGQSHTLPPKKRKASSDEAQTSENKRPRTEVPKDLLKKVNLDHLLDILHGEKIS